MKKFVNKKDVAKIKKLDLLTYLKNYEPEELVKISRTVYGTQTHSSLQISNGMWHWFARGIGGKSALDYLIKVKEMEFLEAAHYLLDQMSNNPPFKMKVSTKDQYKDFKLPKPSPATHHIRDYLCDERKIDEEIVNYCIQHYNIYQSVHDHDVVFVGYDEQNKPRYASKRSTNSNLKREVYGSNKKFGFMLKPHTQSNTVNVFEGAIDALSYCTVLKMEGVDWHSQYMLSVGGAAKKGSSIEESSIPIALTYFLDEHEIEHINLHLDNDSVGKAATEVIQFHLSDKYQIKDYSLKYKKDINQTLVETITIKLRSDIERRR